MNIYIYICVCVYYYVIYCILYILCVGGGRGRSVRSDMAYDMRGNNTASGGARSIFSPQCDIRWIRVSVRATLPLY